MNIDKAALALKIDAILAPRSGDDDFAARYANDTARLDELIAVFPATFGLLGTTAPHRIVRSASYFGSEEGAWRFMLYTFVQTEDGRWLAYAKGDPHELLGVLRPLQRGG